MKKRKKLLLATLIGIFASLFIINIAQALPCRSGDLCYKPNVPIPIQSLDGRYNFDDKEIKVDPDLLANYIVAIYRYGAGFAGIVAMFMLVIAGWRWLMAGGNAQKISASKEMVNGVLIGLALLFGGQLLLRQIADDFDSIKTLDIGEPSVGDSSSYFDRLYCSGFDEELGVVDQSKVISTCTQYNTAERCGGDVCRIVGEEVNGEDVKICVWKGDPDPNIGGCLECPDSCYDSWYGNVDMKIANPCGCTVISNIDIPVGGAGNSPFYDESNAQ